MDLKTKRTICLVIGIASILTIVGTISYAYFTATGETTPVQATINTATVSARFADNDTGITEQLSFGESLTKKFTITNTGTADANVKIYWIDLINTYTEGSLTYTLSYSENEVGPYIEVVNKTNVPKSDTVSKKKLADSLTIPVGKTYYYNLVIVLNYLDDVNQDADLNAVFNSKFGLEDINEKYYVSFDANGGTVGVTNKTITENEVYGALPTPTREGYEFTGWFTSIDGGNQITENSLVENSTDHILYAQWKELNATELLLTKANDESITDYNSGNKGEMFAFDHPEATQTTGWSEEERKDYRYIGANPNNYIDFNDETWRIIGAFTVETESGKKEQLMKIIRDESIENLAWNSSLVNEWSTASIKTLLNGDYYSQTGSYTSTSTIKGLNATARSQIANVKWYLGGANTNQNLGGPDYYAFERGTTVYSGRSTNIVANVGLMYPSDYVYTYANGVDNTCYTDGYSCNTGTSNGWLFGTRQWTISPTAGYANSAFLVYSYGSVNFNAVNGIIAVRPTVFLASDVTIMDGDGSSGNHYKLG